MVLPANTTAITFADINTELGAVGNSTVAAANMPRDLNDIAVRNITPGTGKTISTTQGTAISMDNLSTGRLREFMSVLNANSASYIIGASAPDAEGNIYSLIAPPAATTTLYLLKYNPQMNVIIWGRSITYNNANGSSYNSLIYGSCTINVSGTGNLYIRFNQYYVAKFGILAPFYMGFDSDGNLLWQSTSLATGTSITTAGHRKWDIGVYNNSELVLAPSYGARLNFINASSGALISNVGYAVTNYATPDIINVGGRSNQSNIYAVGYATNTNQYGIVSQFNTSQTINWTRRIDTANTWIEDVVVDSAGSPFVVVRPIASPTLAVVIKINAAGTLQWSRRLTFPANITHVTITNDISDNLYVLAGAVANTTVNGAFFVSSLTSAGASRWHRRITSSTTTNTFYSGTIYSSSSRFNITGNRLLIPIATSSTNGAMWHANTGTPTTGTFAGYTIAAITVTVGTANATGYTDLTTLTGTVTGNTATAMANVNVASSAASPYNITNIT